MKLYEITDYLEEIAPLHLQESYDNSGLIVGERDKDITAALISLDTTEAIVDEAIARGCNLVISHHPIVFSGLKRFNKANYVERTIMKAIKHDIALYAIHTNLDNVHQNGVNQMICDKLGLVNGRILAPNKNMEHKNHAVGAGMIAELPSEMEPIAFLEYLKDKMSVSVVKHTKVLTSKIKTVAVCGGSGSFLLDHAVSAGAQVFVTSDYKYHQFFDANDQIIIADIGHYESEQYTKDLILQLIKQKFRNFASHLTGLSTNPVQYL